MAPKAASDALKSTDIVERLRAQKDDLCWEASYEIERLREVASLWEKTAYDLMEGNKAR